MGPGSVRGRIIVCAAIAALTFAALPAGASATAYSVDSLGDAPDADTVGDPACATAIAECTLRAAIQQANAHSGTDSIGFNQSGGLFDGTTANSQISIGTALPAITSRIDIDGGECGGATSKPCAAVFSPGSPLGPDALILSTGAGNSSIKRLAIYNADRAILISSAVSSVTVAGNWFGQTLAEDTGGGTNNNSLSNQYGVFSFGNSGTIGGTTEADRNLFRSNSYGAWIRSAGATSGLNNTISGNYFGTKADGSAAPAINGYGAVVDGTTASGNLIGGTRTGTIDACNDDACNLFALPTAGLPQIDLGTASGNVFPPGQTTIKGNFVGLNSAGGAGPSTNGIGIAVGDADDVTIGGADPLDGNDIGGGATGISTGAGADHLVIRHNYVGLAPGGSGQVAPSAAGATIAASGVTIAPVISENRFAGSTTSSQTGLTLSGSGGLVQSNTFGVDLDGTTPEPFGGDAVQITGTGSGYTLDLNNVRNGQANGIDIIGDGNTLTGNHLQGNGQLTAGPGVRLQNDADSNQIGPDPFNTPANVNTYVGNSGDAIAARDDGTDFNTILGNVTLGMSLGGTDLFIDLNSDGAGNPANGPNEGIGKPVIAGASLSQAHGTSIANAHVVLFANGFGNAHPNAMLGETTADASGNWSLTYPFALPAGATVFANQTNANGSSSELAGPVVVDDTAPAAPNGLSTTPASPANNNDPLFKGTAEAGSTVSVYKDATCSTIAFATGTAAQFLSGFAFHVADFSTTQLSAKATDAAGNTGPCSSSIDYVEDSTVPPGPTTPTTAPVATTTAPKKCKKGRKLKRGKCVKKKKK